LAEFKQWLANRRFREQFTTPEDLRGKVESALHNWRNARGQSAPPAEGDPAKYFDALRQETAFIDIRGLQVGAGKAYRFPIEDLYIPLTTEGAASGKRGRGKPGDE
jgi:hypothetical protein